MDKQNRLYRADPVVFRNQNAPSAQVQNIAMHYPCEVFHGGTVHVILSPLYGECKFVK